LLIDGRPGTQQLLSVPLAEGIGIGTCSAVAELQRPAMFARPTKEVDGF
jgi:hypothetical protein